MKRLFLFFALLFSISSYAQDSLAANKKNKVILKPLKVYAGDSIHSAGRNEIAVNIAPLFSTLMGSYPNSYAIYSLFYKRGFKNERIYLRAGILFKPEVPHYNRASTDWYFNQTDTSRIANVLQISRKKPVQLNLGIEWRSKGFFRRWSTYGALDLMGGIYKQDFLL